MHLSASPLLRTVHFAPWGREAPGHLEVQGCLWFQVAIEVHTVTPSLSQVAKGANSSGSGAHSALNESSPAKA